METQNDFNSSTIHPLQIYRVLKQTLSYLDCDSLRNCRRVNWKWNHLASLHLRQKDSIYFHCLKTFKKFNDAFLLGKDDTVAFDNRSSTGIPYKSCILASDLMDSESSEFMGFNQSALSFCQEFGHYFTEIHLSLVGGNNSAVRKLFKNILFKWFTNLETVSLLLKQGPFNFWIDSDINSESEMMHKLKNLHVNWIGYNTHTSLDMTQLFNPIFAKCINLEMVSCQMPKFVMHNNTNDQENVALLHSDLNEQLLESILTCDQSFVRKGPILHMQVLLKPSSIKLESFINCHSSSLQTVYLELDESTVNLLRNFFEKFKNLKNVYIEFSKCSKNVKTINIPCVKMMNLSQMTISNYFENGDFNFLHYAPTLKVLQIKQPQRLPKFGSICNSSVASLTISSSKMLISSNHERFEANIHYTFPNLRELKLNNIDNITLQSIFTNLVQLTALHISGKKISDEGICGESDTILRVLLESAVEKSFWEFHPRYPNISSLENLQDFSLNADLITDACIMFGISKCRKIKRLEIRPNLELITNYGFKSLKQLQDLEFLNIHVRNFGWASLKELRCGVNT